MLLTLSKQVCDTGLSIVRHRVSMKSCKQMFLFIETKLLQKKKTGKKNPKGNREPKSALLSHLTSGSQRTLYMRLF